LAAPAIQTSPSTRPTRILIVDDHDGIRRLMRRILESQDGIAAEEAQNGRIALERIADDDAYDVITLDLMMPEVDGYAVLAELERSRPELLSHVVVMTGCSEAATEDLSRRYSVVPKPFNSAELLTAVEHCAGRA
jgi:CheY-like chemotaxis protein